MAIKYGEPFKSFRFLVEVEDDGGTQVVAAFTEFSGVKVSVQYAQMRSGSDIFGAQMGVPALSTIEPVKLTQGVVGDNSFIEWLQSVACSDVAGPTGESVARTITVVALDDKGNRGVEWTLSGVKPLSYELSPMDGGSSGVLTESMEFSVSGFKRAANEPK